MIQVFLSLALSLVPPVVSPLSEPETQRESLSPAERLDERLEALQSAEREETALLIADEVLSLWRQQGGATAELLLDRGIAAESADDVETAKRQYYHLRTLEPEFAEGWIASARLAMREGDWPFAMEALSQAIELEPRRFDAYAFLGRTLEQANENPAALAAYERALELFPLMPAARSGKARIERQMAGRAL